MSTQQDIYAAGFESRPPMLNKENYVPWSSRLLWYAKSRPNGKLIHNSILNGPYVRKMIPEPDIYAAVDSCETAQEIWLQMMKGSDIGIQEKKAKLFNEWERFTFDEGELIESYYHRFLNLMNALKRNKHFPEKIASNLMFLNNLQPEWSRHVTILHQTKDLHAADYTQLYDFLKYNQKEVDELKPERITKTQDPLELMANSNNPYAFPAPHQDQSSFNQNYLQQPMPNPEDITDPITAMNMALALMAKAFKLNYSTPTNNNQIISSNPRNREIAQPGMNMGQDRQMQKVRGNGGNQFRQYAGQNAGNLAGYNDVIWNRVIQNAIQNPRVQNVGNQNGLIDVQGNGNQNQIENGNLVAARAEGNAAGQNGNQIRCYNCRGVGIQLQAEEYDLMAAAADLDEIEEVNANYILMANLQKASTSGTQTDSALVYDKDESTKVHENCDDSEIFNMFTQEEQYTELLEPIPESHQVPQNHNDVISEDTSVEQEETLQLAQDSRDKMKQMNKEIKPANYTKINYPSGVFVPQKALSREELYFSNNSKTVNVSKSFLIPNEDLSDDTTPSVARKFLNEVDAVPLVPRNSHGKKQKAKVSFKETQMKYQPKVTKPKNVGTRKSLATPKPRKPRFLLRVYNRRTKKIMETMNVSFDELSAMAFEQRSSKPGLNNMTSRHISSGLDLTYAPSTITTQQPSKGKLDLLFEAMYDDYIGVQLSATTRTIPPAQEPQVRQSSTVSTLITDIAPIPTNSSSLATNILISSQDVDELNTHAMVDGNTFVNPFANPSTSVATASSSQQNVDPSNMHTFY
nr:hypothetical protein [Tanacetum cinerariifolium]